MKPVSILLVLTVLGSSFAYAQTTAPTPAKASDTLQLQMLTKKIEEQNAKIDILSQHILKLEQQISHSRTGIMIGEAEPSGTSAAAPTPAPHLPGITSHTVARGETLTSIAKLYGVTISELQRFNHIDDPLKLRAGQIIMIPPAQTPAPTSPSQ